MSAPALAMLAAATAPMAARAAATPAANANPFGVDASKPLDVLMWKAGWGDEYALKVIDIYKSLYAGVEIKYQAVQDLPPAAQPRFAAGTPPDVIEATQLDRASLVSDSGLTELSDLLAAPSYDIAGKTVAETLRPNSQTTAVFDGKPYAVNFTYYLNGIWYNAALMEAHGWEYPTTWDGMLTLCETIKASGGVAPWTYQGKYPVYVADIFHEMLWKHGGDEAVAKLDNLEPDAWKQDAVRAALEPLFQLANKDYIMPGTAGLTHTEAQAEWLQGKAVFIPCGTWLENEEKGLIPPDFKMTFQPVPSVTATDKVPFTGITAGSGQPFVVPAQAQNPAGGKEFIRLLCSKQSADFFSQNTRALTTIIGGGDGLDLGPAFASASVADKNANGQSFDSPLFLAWYKTLGDEEANQMGRLMTKQASVDDFINAVQQAADDVAADDSIAKHHR